MEVDLFLDPPTSYAALAERAERRMVGKEPRLIAALPDLVAMKRAAGRPNDVEDIAALEAIVRQRSRA